MLRRVPEYILINTIDADSVVAIGAAGDGAYISGYGEILSVNVLDCTITCEDDCVPKIVTVAVDIPTSCECPYEWSLTIECKPNLTGEVQNTFSTRRLYTYMDPAGGTPTDNATATQVVADINADPNTCVTATVSPAGTIRLTAKDCTHDFSAYTSAGVVTIVTPFTRQLIDADYFAKLFPIQPGAFGARPKLTYCGSYCIYHLKIRSTNDTQDISAANHYNGYEREVYFVVNTDDANYTAMWHDELQTAIPCLDDFS